jgi:hypothetical protein
MQLLSTVLAKALKVIIFKLLPLLRVAVLYLTTQHSSNVQFTIRLAVLQLRLISQITLNRVGALQIQAHVMLGVWGTKIDYKDLMLYHAI